jgi:hypothetical protein
MTFGETAENLSHRSKEVLYREGGQADHFLWAWVLDGDGLVMFGVVDGTFHVQRSLRFDNIYHMLPCAHIEKTSRRATFGGGCGATSFPAPESPLRSQLIDCGVEGLLRVSRGL